MDGRHGCLHRDSVIALKFAAITDVYRVLTEHGAIREPRAVVGTLDHTAATMAIALETANIMPPLCGSLVACLPARVGPCTELVAQAMRVIIVITFS